MSKEVVQAKKSLKQLTAEILTAAKDLGDLNERVDAARSEHAKLLVEKEQILAELTRLGILRDSSIQEIGNLEVATTNQTSVLRAVDGLTSLATDALALSKKEKESVTEDIEGLELSRELKEVLIVDEQERYDSLVLLVEELEARERVASARLSEWKAKVAREAVRFEKIQGAIEDALSSFRIFEKRIAQFSLETGYLVSYKDPALVDKEK